jgi:hypothetical protein
MPQKCNLKQRLIKKWYICYMNLAQNGIRRPKQSRSAPGFRVPRALALCRITAVTWDNKERAKAKNILAWPRGGAELCQCRSKAARL